MAVAAQLIANIGVTGEASFAAALKRAERHMNALAETGRNVGSTLRNLVNPLNSLIGISGAAGIIGLGVAAVKASADFEQLKVTLEVLTGSAEVASKKLDFIKQLAIPSTFTFSELADAGVQLESFGVRLEKVLPLAAKVGAAFHLSSEGLSEFVRIFGRLRAGDFPDIEVLSRFGLSKQAFKEKGIQFDKQGTLLSSARDTMKALEQIVNDRYGNILDKISGTTNAKLASVKDRWEETLRKIGDSLQKYLLPVLDKFEAFLARLNSDRSFDRWLKNLGANITKFVGLMFGLVATMLGVVALVKLAFGDFVGAALAALASGAVAAIGVYATIATGKFFKGLNKGNPQDSRGKATVPEAPPGMDYFNGEDPVQANIERNTRQTAMHTKELIDIRRNALGGGQLGALGVTPVEFAAFRSQGRQVVVKVEGAGNLESMVANIAQQVLNGWLRRNPGR